MTEEEKNTMSIKEPDAEIKQIQDAIRLRLQQKSRKAPLVTKKHVTKKDLDDWI
jgi:hypothetical protein